jgi:hypothetical protein
MVAAQLILQRHIFYIYQTSLGFWLGPGNSGQDARRSEEQWLAGQKKGKSKWDQEAPESSFLASSILDTVEESKYELHEIISRPICDASTQQHA